MPSRIRSRGVRRCSSSSRVLSRRAQIDECAPAPPSTQAEIPGNEQDDDDKADDVNDLIHDLTPRVSHQVDCARMAADADRTGMTASSPLSSLCTHLQSVRWRTWRTWVASDYQRSFGASRKNHRGCAEAVRQRLPPGLVCCSLGVQQ